MASVFAIGIAGGTCSGKTTLATALCAHLGSQASVVLSMDNFYRQQSEEILASGIVNFEHPGALDLESFVTAFESLRSGHDVWVPDYDRRMSRIQGSIVLRARPVLIVEGLFVLFEKWLSEHLDLAIFIEVDPAVRLSRRLKRDVLEYGIGPERVHDTYERYVVPAYAEFVAPTRGVADLIVSGSTNIKDLLAQVMTRSFVKS